MRFPFLMAAMLASVAASSEPVPEFRFEPPAREPEPELLPSWRDERRRQQRAKHRRRLKAKRGWV